MPNNYLSVLYKHIIQVENENVGLKVAGGHKHTIAPPPPPQSKSGGHMSPLPPPPASYASDTPYCCLTDLMLKMLVSFRLLL